MSDFFSVLRVLGIGLAIVAVHRPAVASDPQELRKQASWNWPPATQWRTSFDAWIDRALSGETQRDARDAS
ncbi:MAG: hypothetical protein ACK57P_13285, partial [Planctomycetota bacterium]